jgi:hypothetical protein
MSAPEPNGKTETQIPVGSSEIVSRRPVPVWLGPALTAARHQDKINSWPWWARVLHKMFISPKCPACQHWKKMQKGG